MVETSENTEILHFQGNKKRRDLRKTRKSRLQTWGSVVQIPTDTSTYLFISTVKLSVKKPRNRCDSWVSGVHIFFVLQWCLVRPKKISTIFPVFPSFSTENEDFSCPFAFYISSPEKDIRWFLSFYSGHGFDSWSRSSSKKYEFPYQLAISHKPVTIAASRKQQGISIHLIVFHFTTALAFLHPFFVTGHKTRPVAFLLSARVTCGGSSKSHKRAQALQRR